MKGGADAPLLHSMEKSVRFPEAPMNSGSVSTSPSSVQLVRAHQTNVDFGGYCALRSTPLTPRNRPPDHLGSLERACVTSRRYGKYGFRIARSSSRSALLRLE